MKEGERRRKEGAYGKGIENALDALATGRHLTEPIIIESDRDLFSASSAPVMGQSNIVFAMPVQWTTRVYAVPSKQQEQSQFICNAETKQETVASCFCNAETKKETVVSTGTG